MTAPRPATPRNLPSTALLTDLYELTMVSAALADGTADRPSTFEVFARNLPGGRRYGVLAGLGRLLPMIAAFRFGDDELAAVEPFLDAPTLAWLADYRFTGDIDGFTEGELYFPGSPVLTVRAGFAEAVVLETLVLSVLNHDSAVATAAARMVTAAGGRRIIEMGSRRTHEQAAVAAARAAYLAGFTSTSNLEAARTFGVPAAGTSAHAFTLLHSHPEGTDELAAFRSQVARFGTGTTLLIDTYDITQGVEHAVQAAGPELGAVRIDSGDLGVLARQVRQQLDSLGATTAKIVVSGDLDEYAIAALRADPVDVYGVGTSVVVGSGSPTAGMVYKLAEVDGIPVEKRSSHKQSRGGYKHALRLRRESGTLVEEVVYPAGMDPREAAGPLGGGLEYLEVTTPLVRGGQPVLDDALDVVRTRVAAGLVSLPWEGLSLSAGEPAVQSRFVPAPHRS